MLLFSSQHGSQIGFGTYILLMLVFLGTSIILHELGHILFARYNHLDYRILFRKGNITIDADWERIGDRKVYGHIAGIVAGLPPVIIGMLLYSTPVFLLLYLLACYDDFSAVAKRLLHSRRIFGIG